MDKDLGDILLKSAIYGDINKVLQILNKDASLVNYADEVVSIFFFIIIILYINSLLYYPYIFDQLIGSTSLHYAAAYWGHTSAVAHLIEKGAGINIQNKVIFYNLY